jgi:Phytanoyl-CoA dioxygenase (PhyH)
MSAGTMSSLMSSEEGPGVLDQEGLEQFVDHGYLVLPGFLPAELVDRLKPEVDRWVDGGFRARSIEYSKDPHNSGAAPSVVELDLPAHGELVAHPPLLAMLQALMGGDFVFHHLHSDRQPADQPGKAWHHDYEQEPQRDRALPMIHVLHYPDGLEEDTASLVVLPGSHHEVAEKDARAVLGTQQLPGERMLGYLPAGSSVVVHSAVFHARRALLEPSGKDRYFVDASYCRVGALWPPVKPYWRDILRRGRDRGLGRGYPELFSERHFTEFQRPERRS